MAAGHRLVRTFAGVNLAVRATELKDQELALAKNVWQPEMGIVARRPMQRLPEGTFTTYVENNCLYHFIDSAGAEHLMVWDAGTVYEVEQNTYNVIGGGLVTWGGGDLIPPAPDNLVYNHKLYIWAPFGMQVISGTGGNAALEAPPAWNNELGHPRTGVVFNEALMIGGFPPPYENAVRFTPIGIENWHSLMPLPWMIQVGGGGDPLIALREFPVHGGAKYIQPYVMAFKRNSVWMISGTMPLETTTIENIDLVVSPVNQEEGLVSKDTLCWTEHGLVWCSGRNVWLSPYGGTPRQIGEQIAPHLKKLPTDPKMWHAVYADGHYRLSVPASFTAGPTEEWWCDLRDYDTNKKPFWWGPQSISSRSSVAIKTASGDTEVLSIINSQTSALRKLHRFEEQSDPSPDHDASIELRLKEFDFGDPMLEKLIEGLEVNYWTQGYGVIIVEMWGDGFSEQTAIWPQIEAIPSGFILGTSLLGGEDQLVKKFVSTVVYPPNGQRFIVRTWQPVLRTSQYQSYALPHLEIRALGLRIRPIGRRPTP